MIRFERFELDNGLKVLIHEDDSTPMAAVNVLYNVGARDESPEKTGFAHLFEHLMFGGSANIPDFDTPIQMAGGENNAFTNNDITNFYDILPAENLEVALWLESDRMLSLNFDERVLEVQRKVVVEEFKETYPKAGISLEFSSLPSDPEKLLYRGYYHLIRIAIGNLLENAIKFSGNTIVKLKLDISDEKLAVSITDNGIGIPEEAQPHIFTPFFRADNAQGFPGYGVGLALADKVVKMHDGQLKLLSSQQKGTTFILELPF